MRTFSKELLVLNDREHVPENEADYEHRYAEALTILREKYESVGVPYQNQHGERVCDVETLHADDLTVFMLAWGAETAYQIRGNERLEGDRKSPQKQHSQARSATRGR